MAFGPEHGAGWVVPVQRLFLHCLQRLVQRQRSALTATRVAIYQDLLGGHDQSEQLTVLV